MASPLMKSNRMKRTESKKSHSWWWDSHISPKNSKWLQENLEEMDELVKRMLKLIEEDADSFAKKAELYFKKRPELIALVEDFYRMYRSLAERYDNVTGELRRNIPSDLHSQGSTASDVTVEPSPDRRPARTKSGPRAAGFDVFLGSDRSSKEGDEESSTLDSESESDDDSSSTNNYAEQPEGELQGKLPRLQKEESYGSSDFSSKLQAYEDELRRSRENIRKSEEEVARLMAELEKYKSLEKSSEFVQESERNDDVFEVREGSNVPESGEGKFRELEEEVANLRKELTSKGLALQSLQEQLKTVQKEIPVWKNKVEREKREVTKLQDRMTRYKNNLSERDQEIRGLQEAISNANKTLSEENERLKSEITKITKERAYLEDNLKEFDLRCQLLEEDVRRAKAATTETEAVFGIQIERLKAEIAERDELLEELESKYEKLMDVKHELDERVGEMREHLDHLHSQHAELIGDADVARRSAEELRLKVEELEREVGRKEEALVEGAEGKREAIRQLCFSLEHYRMEYCELREAVMAHKRSVMAA
ncbi:kinase interacting family protein [Striga asiatica]|uniref:Kinase interacting family protein n=1 Tax=Striga asiatica TaxID=4170 RepID=A0A5A7P5R8_STRAF|nr:kinase interacting family protein [Striga asiatica]